MQWLVEIGLSNAAVAVVLAAVAWGIGAYFRRPAVTHAVCVLVLLKLLTPPIIELPLPLPIGQVADVSSAGNPTTDSAMSRNRASSRTSASAFAMQPSGRQVAQSGVLQHMEDGSGPVPSVSPERRPAARRHGTDFPSDSSRANETQVESATPVPGGTILPQFPELDHADRIRDDTVTATATRTTRNTYLSWALLGRLLIAVWLVGMIVWFCLQAVLGLRLRAILRRSRPGPLALRKSTLRLARQMGLRHPPPVVVVSATTSPMLCGLGSKTCIVLPAELLRRLSPGAQTAVLAHELAHYRRGDQWVRLVELIATGLYWWHPVVWWVRRRLEDTEEQCCDAHVLAECGSGPRIYAEAILDIVDFVSEPVARVQPVLSSGIRQRPFLQRRLTDLMEGACVPNIGPGSRRMIAIAGALCLCYHPTFFVTPAATAHATSAPRVQELTGRNAVPGAGPVLQPPRPPARGSTPAPADPLPSDVQTESGIDFDIAPADEIWATAISPNGRYQVSVRPGYACELREVINSYVRELTGHQIVCVAFSPDSGRFVTGELDGTVRQWDAASGIMLAVLEQRRGAVYSVAYSPAGDALAAAGEDGAVHVLQLDSLHEDPRVVHVGDSVRCVRFSPTGEQLAIAVDTWRSPTRGRLAVYHVHSQRLVQQWQTNAPLGAVHYLSHDEVLAAEWSGRVVHCSVARPFGTNTTTIAKELVSAASFSPDTRVFEAVVEEIEVSVTPGKELEDRT